MSEILPPTVQEAGHALLVIHRIPEFEVITPYLVTLIDYLTNGKILDYYPEPSLNGRPSTVTIPLDQGTVLILTPNPNLTFVSPGWFVRVTGSQPGIVPTPILQTRFETAYTELIKSSANTLA